MARVNRHYIPGCVAIGREVMAFKMLFAVQIAFLKMLIWTSL